MLRGHAPSSAQCYALRLTCVKRRRCLAPIFGWRDRSAHGAVYKHILLPSDGSPLAQKAVEAGIELARSLGARVTAFTAVPEYRTPGQSELMSGHAISLAAYEEQARRAAESILRPIVERARAAGVDCDSDYAQSEHPHAAIVLAAEAHACDLIFMASHRRRGLSALVHGSETQGVLTRSTIPTLVYR